MWMPETLGEGVVNLKHRSTCSFISHQRRFYPLSFKWNKYLFPQCKTPPPPPPAPPTLSKATTTSAHSRSQYIHPYFPEGWPLHTHGPFHSALRVDLSRWALPAPWLPRWPQPRPAVTFDRLIPDLDCFSHNIQWESFKTGDDICDCFGFKLDSTISSKSLISIQVQASLSKDQLRFIYCKKIIFLCVFWCIKHYSSYFLSSFIICRSNLCPFYVMCRNKRGH